MQYITTFSLSFVVRFLRSAHTINIIYFIIRSWAFHCNSIASMWFIKVYLGSVKIWKYIAFIAFTFCFSARTLRLGQAGLRWKVCVGLLWLTFPHPIRWELQNIAASMAYREWIVPGLGSGLKLIKLPSSSSKLKRKFQGQWSFIFTNKTLSDTRFCCVITT